MDPNFRSSKPIKDTVTCLLCKSVIRYEQKDTKKYVNHMRRDHGAFYNINLILIINLLGKETSKKLIKNIYKERYHKKTDSELFSENESHDSKEASVQTEPNMFDAEVQTDFADDIESKFSGVEFLNDLQHFVAGMQGGERQQDGGQNLDESILSLNSEEPSEDDLYIPSDAELDEAIPMSTPNSKDAVKIKEEKVDYFIPPDIRLDPIDVFLEDEDFNILDVTKEDLVLTPGGPMPINDYSNFIPNSLIPPQYNPSHENTESATENDFDDSLDKKFKQGRKRKDINYSECDSESEEVKRRSVREKDLVCLYLKEESKYFQNTKNEISTSSMDRARKFTEADQSLPAGWKWRSFTRKSGRVDYEFLSPEMKVLRSRVGVVEYMKAMGGYTDVEMTRVLPVRIKKEKF